MLALVIGFGKVSRFSGYSNFVDDEAKLLSNSTISEIDKTNEKLEKKYFAKVMVVTRDDLGSAESMEKYASQLYDDYGLNENDMLLLLVKDHDWYVDCTQKVSGSFTTKDLGTLSSVMNANFSSGNYNKAVSKFMSAAMKAYKNAGF